LAYSDLEAVKNFYYLRKREIEEVILILGERVEAEKAYATRLTRIANSQQGKGGGGISIGKLGEEISAFKMDCIAKAR
jgi:hypothetical protein